MLWTLFYLWSYQRFVRKLSIFTQTTFLLLPSLNCSTSIVRGREAVADSLAEVNPVYHRVRWAPKSCFIPVPFGSRCPYCWLFIKYWMVRTETSGREGASFLQEWVLFQIIWFNIPQCGMLTPFRLQCLHTGQFCWQCGASPLKQ